MLPDSLALRSISEADFPFLIDLYGSTREQELAQTGWNDEQKRTFINMQFEAQHHHYQEHYKNASFDLILHKNNPIGRLYLEEWQDQYRVIDIALLPQHCNQGIGSWFLRNIMHQATKVNKAVSIHVERNNPALRLYQRLGFSKVEEHGIYDLMVWQEKLLAKEKE